MSFQFLVLWWGFGREGFERKERNVLLCFLSFLFLDFLSLFLLFGVGRDMALGGGVCFLFLLFFWYLASRIQLALIGLHILSWWFLQNNVQIGGFIDFVCKLARRNLFPLFLLSFGRPRHRIDICILYFIIFQDCKYIYIYIYTHIYIYICLYLSHGKIFFFS